MSLVFSLIYLDFDSLKSFSTSGIDDYVDYLIIAQQHVLSEMQIKALNTIMLPSSTTYNIQYLIKY
ncbi:hypothetical protein CEAn_00024 [Coxiella endosymbiont of Amblyomma nuttalli]|nr:hypothetical protein CEAn_00024 [Coxiella endosymbiont of Amblyomma nuttalli]